jgi:hypothetical protein
LNAILYVISSKADFPKKESQIRKIEKKIANAKSFLKKERLNQETKAISSLDYFEVGLSEQQIILKNQHDNENSESVDYSRLDRKILRRFMVRGHWRNQRYGSGLTETKLIWIKPYIKGDELAEVINKPYVIKE